MLWKSLQIKKRDMEQRNGHQNNERRLFHGTCHTTVAHINDYGFNRSYAGKNGEKLVLNILDAVESDTTSVSIENLKTISV